MLSYVENSIPTMPNLLDHPICFRQPLRLAPSEWAEHVPFGMFLVDILRPATIVELGTLSGVSYCAFCQAVAELGLECKCYAVDNWEGDPQSGFYGPEILSELKQYHDPLYSDFSTLIKSTFDEALGRFAHSTIDLLHIDGYHTYASVKHDFETWLPKMSNRGVVLFHDTHERGGDFGVWKLWEELQQEYPHFGFTHGHGLGVLAVGSSYPTNLRELFEVQAEDSVVIGEMFQRLGERLSIKLNGEHAIKTLSWQVQDKEQIISSVSSQLSDKDSTLGERDKAIKWLQQELGELRASGQKNRDESSQLRGNAEKDQSTISRLAALTKQLETSLQSVSKLLATERKKTATLEEKLVEDAEKTDQMIRVRDQGILWLRKELAESQRNNSVLTGRLAAKTEKLDHITRSLGWRLLSRYGRIKYRYLMPVYRLFDAVSVNPGQAMELQHTPVRATDQQSGVPFEPIGTPEFLPPIGKLSLTTDERFEKKTEDGFYKSLSLLPRPHEEELHAILSKKSPLALHHHDVVCLSIIDWDFRFQRPQQIMAQFAAAGHRVFYVSTTRSLPDDSMPRFRARLIKENVYEVELAARWLPDVYGEVVNGRNKSALLSSLEELRRVFQINEAVAYTMISSWTAVALEARERWGWRVTYDCMDEWESFPGIKKPLLEAERKLVKECDLLVVTAQRLYEKWQGHNDRIVLARNAVDFDFYSDRYGPNALLTNVKHPIVGYYGAIADWFDIDLLTHVAQQRPDHSFVLLGGVFDVDISELKALPNVHFLGQQPYETMPQYLYHFDACIIPFKINKITEATDPVKVYEYLSAGKPVVSVDLAELEPFREYLYIGKDKDDFVVQLDRAVAERDSEAVNRRISFASAQTWPERYKKIEAGLSATTPRASIIVVTYNNLALNKLCLESIIRNTDYPNYEVIVVDNNSTDGTHAYLRYMAAQHPNIQVVLNSQNAGFARANNQGIAQSSGEFIVLLNNDTIVPPGWLSRLLRHLQNPAVGMVGPVTNFAGNEAKVDAGYRTLGEMEAFAAQQMWANDGCVADIHMLAMFCVAFRRDTYETIGPLDEQFGIGMFEDDDYSLRMKKCNLHVICAADVFVHHFGQAAFKKLIERGEYDDLFNQNRRRYETKWNVKWIPHQNAQLRFEPLGRHAPSFDPARTEASLS